MLLPLFDGLPFYLLWPVLAAIGGILGTQPPVKQTGAVDPEVANIAFRALPAVILGGLDSAAGALLGGIIIGLAEIFVRRADAQSALIIARQGVLMSGRQDARALAALAMAQALGGAREDAQATAAEALALARATGDEELIDEVQARVGSLAR